MKTYIDVINETVSFYSEDVSRRSMNDRGRCLYNGPDGKHCAVARCANSIPLKYEGKTASVVIKALGMDMFKEEYRHLTNVHFWRGLQNLHDGGHHWDKKGGGLTAAGEREVRHLKKLYENKSPWIIL